MQGWTSDFYPVVYCLQLKLEEDMRHLQEEMEKTQMLQAREQQALAEWQVLGLHRTGGKAQPGPRALLGLWDQWTLRVGLTVMCV